MVFDPVATRIAKVSLAAGNLGLWEDYLINSQLKAKIFCSTLTLVTSMLTPLLMAISWLLQVSQKSSPADYYGGALPNPINITF